MNVENLHEELSAKTIAQIRAYAADQGIQLPSKGRKAELIRLLIDLLSTKAAPAEEAPKKEARTEAQLMRLTKAELTGVAEAEGVRVTTDMSKPEITAAILSTREAKELEAKKAEERSASTTITLSCGHPFEVDHRNVFPQNVKAYLRKAEKEAACPRCPETTEEPAAPTSTQAKKSSATKAPKRKAPKKKAGPRGWGFSSKEGGHADASRRLMRARTPEAKAEIAEELITATGWTVSTPDSPLTVYATYGDATLSIQYPAEGEELIEGKPSAPLIRLWKSSNHKGRRLLNVSAAVKAANGLMEELAQKTTPKAEQPTADLAAA